LGSYVNATLNAVFLKLRASNTESNQATHNYHASWILVICRERKQIQSPILFVNEMCSALQMQMTIFPLNHWLNDGLFPILILMSLTMNRLNEWLKSVLLYLSGNLFQNCALQNNVKGAFMLLHLYKRILKVNISLLSPHENPCPHIVAPAQGAQHLFERAKI
jgi:hypothetical protein